MTILKTILLSCALFIPLLGQSSPAIRQLLIHKETKECLVYFPGDEHFNNILNNPDAFESYSEGFNQILKTSMGECDYTNQGIDVCCEKLELKNPTSENIKKYISGPVYVNTQKTPPPPIEISSPAEKINNLVPKTPVTTATYSENESIVRYLLIAFIVSIISFLIIIKLFKKIKNKFNLSKTQSILWSFFFFLIYPIICVVLTAYQTSSTITNHDTIAPLFILAFYCVLVLATTALTSLVSLLFILFNKNFLALTILVLNLLLALNANEIIPQFVSLYYEKYEKPKIDQEKKTFQNDIKSWGQKIAFDNVPPQLELTWSNNDQEVLVQNKYPVKIYFRIRVRNQDRNISAMKPHDSLMEMCEVVYDLEIKPNETRKIKADQCSFPVIKSGYRFSVRTEIGYNLMSEDF